LNEAARTGRGPLRICVDVPADRSCATEGDAVIGILNSFSPAQNRTGGPVSQGLSETGYVAGR
jgi:hypothetical protein